MEKFQFQAGHLSVTYNQKGYIETLEVNGKNYLPLDVQAPLIRVVKQEKVYLPTQAVVEGERIYLAFQEARATIKLGMKGYSNYLTLEVEEIIGEGIDTLIWGPYPTSIQETIGEIIGVVRDQETAIGMQALNIKTLTGWPCELTSEFDDQGEQSLFSVSVCGFKYPDLTAAPTQFGSVIQGYCRDRRHDRIGQVWTKEHVCIEGFEGEDAEIVGSKIALFGCHPDMILDTIEKIEVEQNLPHPMIEGEWVKTARKAMMSYLITDFSEANIEDVLDMAQKGGFEYIYHPDPFTHWGHFKFRNDHFPTGEEGMKGCVEQAQAKGIGVGVHTLTTFTTTNDAYVTPVPDQRLAKVQTTYLVEDLDEEADCIALADVTHFEEVDTLGAALVGNEIIQYEYVKENDGKFYLMDCTRGAFGTQSAPHKANERISKLWDYPYKVLFPNLELQEEYIDRLVALFNELGLKQISFDGLEGCLATGHEAYSICRMVAKYYEGCNHEVINDSSRLHHYLWHIHTRTNWGEPWGAKMREGQTELRTSNQPFYKRNLFPRMLGWFLIRLAERKFEATTPDEVEWMLSRAAGFDAGFSICMDYKVMKDHGYSARYMELTKQWERARARDAFTKEQKARLIEDQEEWHLEKVGEDKWILYPIHISKEYMCDPEQLQPGQPGGADWNYTNKFHQQVLQFRLKAASLDRNSEGYIENPCFRINGKKYMFKCRVRAHQYLVYEGGKEATICDQNFKTLSTVKLSSSTEVTSECGPNPIIFNCDFGGEDRPCAEVRFIVKGQGEAVSVQA
ncbi:MAG: hypothetical protein RSC14_01690 [Niameybacter sp.]